MRSRTMSGVGAVAGRLEQVRRHAELEQPDRLEIGAEEQPGRPEHVVAVRIAGIHLAVAPRDVARRTRRAVHRREAGAGAPRAALARRATAGTSTPTSDGGTLRCTRVRTPGTGVRPANTGRTRAAFRRSRTARLASRGAPSRAARTSSRRMSTSRSARDRVRERSQRSAGRRCRAPVGEPAGSMSSTVSARRASTRAPLRERHQFAAQVHANAVACGARSPGGRASDRATRPAPRARARPERRATPPPAPRASSPSRVRAKSESSLGVW